MLIVKSFRQRITNESKEFVTLELQGGLEFVQSLNTGKFHGCIRKRSIHTTFTVNVAKMLIGLKIAGTIVRQECQPYKYKIHATGEELMPHTLWGYQPESVYTLETARSI
jgi:hypothetical protein